MEAGPERLALNEKLTGGRVGAFQRVGQLGAGRDPGGARDRIDAQREGPREPGRPELRGELSLQVAFLLFASGGEVGPEMSDVLSVGHDRETLEAVAGEARVSFPAEKVLLADRRPAQGLARQLGDQRLRLTAYPSPFKDEIIDGCRWEDGRGRSRF